MRAQAQILRRASQGTLADLRVNLGVSVLLALLMRNLIICIGRGTMLDGKRFLIYNRSVGFVFRVLDLVYCLYFGFQGLKMHTLRSNSY